MLKKALILTIALTHSFSSFANTCQELELQKNALEDKIYSLNERLLIDRDNLSQAIGFVAGLEKEVDKNHSILKVTATVTGGIITIASSVGAIKLVRVSRYSGGGIGGNIGSGIEKMGASLLSIVGLTAGAATTSSIVSMVVSKKSLAKAKSSQDIFSQQLDFQIQKLQSQERILKRVEKKYYQICQ